MLLRKMMQLCDVQVTYSHTRRVGLRVRVDVTLTNYTHTNNTRKALFGGTVDLTTEPDRAAVKEEPPATATTDDRL